MYKLFTLTASCIPLNLQLNKLCDGLRINRSLQSLGIEKCELSAANLRVILDVVSENRNAAANLEVRDVLWLDIKILVSRHVLQRIALRANKLSPEAGKIIGMQLMNLVALSWIEYECFSSSGDYILETVRELNLFEYC